MVATLMLIRVLRMIGTAGVAKRFNKIGRIRSIEEIGFVFLCYTCECVDTSR